MKRLTLMVSLAAFLAALAAPLAFAQGSPAPAATPAAEPAKVAPVRSAGHATMKKPAVHAEAVKCDINSASREELMKLPGVGDAIADKIIAGRPYKTKADLASRKVVGVKAYAKLRGMIIAKQAESAVK